MDNDAFRKIMATPRPHDGKPQEKFDKKSIRKLVDADLQRSKAGSKKHKREKPAKEKKVDKKKEKKPSKYRDRAEEERRTDTNKDYSKDDNIAALEVDAEASKYLGGDVAHTHLVRGLDRALLEKTRRTCPKLCRRLHRLFVRTCRETGYAISESGSSLLRTGSKVGDGF